MNWLSLGTRVINLDTVKSVVEAPHPHTGEIWVYFLGEAKYQPYSGPEAEAIRAFFRAREIELKRPVKRS